MSGGEIGRSCRLAVVEQRLVADAVAGRRGVAGVDDVLERLAALAQVAGGVEPSVVGDEHPRSGVVDHERQLVRREPVVEAVDHAAVGGHGEPALQVRGGVAGQRADEGAGRQPEAVERAAEARDARAQLAVGQLPVGVDDGGAVTVNLHRVLERPTQAA